jgi:LemA protein
MQYYTYLALAAVVVLLWFIITFNGFISLRNRVEEAFSTMDVFLKQRYDLLPNFVETVKGYATHEKETLDAVISARAKAVNAQGIDSRITAEQGLIGALSKLLMLTENYPDLKANANFMELQQQLKTLESEIADARTAYNGMVKQFNTKVESIPSNIVAGICGFSRQPLFEITETTQRTNVTVQF